MGDGSESVEVRVARLEERTENLEKWIQVLQADIKETQLLIAALDQKLDRAIELSQRSVPTWVTYIFWLLFSLLGVMLGGRVKF
ncbi:MAG: hypothetical protein C7B44_15730 [Sulfobacillus thermosulfidooxidans]|uniref:Uncharacterized protein n=1 Tax=Sulfobacillus thermotolerans TaxID=338644 RepID=A0ABM6RR85_9FIRM|nr:hypothetical protein [Sulfobacillus sp. hq2]AUW93834.1 hypothetical protein BXT84_07675 [Sulfobacillus thermotolerans]MCY0909652.1 hypothetical protein [Sulfobacillus thermotolerans]POB11352.1 hypothetical protein CO251_05420 [Sulfobacillus sp. hq2]PSR31644.1 MAG: hypothetical protein C7B44_15730 [Sulfobacillus thermosulfidooxidans]